MLLPGCALDPYEIPSEEQYVRDFISKYGLPDTEHTWSMATSVKAELDVQGLKDGTVEVYTAYPGSTGARLVARMPISSGSASANLPLVSGTESVYVLVKDQDNTIRSVSSMPVQNNSISGQLKMMSTPGDDKLPTKEEMSLSSPVVSPTVRAFYQMFLNDEYYVAEEDRSTFTYPDAFNLYSIHASDFDPDLIKDETTEDGSLNQNRIIEEIPNLFYLNGLYYEMGEALSYKNVLAPIFDTYSYTDPKTGETVKDVKGVFKEGINNLDLYYYNGVDGKRLDPDVTFKVKTDGPVPMQCIWRGTEKNDYFGYYYYPADKELTSEDIWNLPKYVFLNPEDIPKLSNLTQSSGNKISEPAESDWQDMTGMNCGSLMHLLWRNPDDPDKAKEDVYVRGRKYYLAYYGDNYDQPASYDFPKDTKIGYFLYKDDGDRSCIFFSDCKTEYEICRRKYKEYSDEENEGPLVRPFAAKFSM